MKITKPDTLTPTESLLAQLCDRLFLRLWSWPTPRKDDGKELCDLIALFDDHVFIFFDRESKALQNTKKDITVTWQRWKKEVIDKQVSTAKGAARYIRDGGPIFLDNRCEQSFPGVIPERPIIHKIIVAHGAEDACEADSKNNVYGSLGIVYVDTIDTNPTPFVVKLERHDPVHVLDSFNLGVVLRELDTFHDFLAYISEKEKAIGRHHWLGYCGEEDLLARYFMDYDRRRERYLIRPEKPSSMFWIPEGSWKHFAERGLQQRRHESNKQSYLWDELIQRTYQNALEDVTTGASLWNGKDALLEMAREPRLSRRALSDQMLEAIRGFPPIYGHRVTCMPAHDADKAYVFLQVRFREEGSTEAVQARQGMLEIACGAARNRFPDLKTVVGIAMDAPMHANHDGEDFLLLDCEEWTEEHRLHFERQNAAFGFFKKARRIERQISDFG